MNNLDDLQKRLKAIAEIVNAFKSEAVQLRVIEVLLGQLGVPAASDDVARAKASRRTKHRTASAKTDTLAKGEKTTPQKATRKSPRTSASPGAFAMISQLLDEGFFKSPKTISAIVAHCGSSKGHHYKGSECSPALLRLLRDNKLKRSKNKDGQYEYTQS